MGFLKSASAVFRRNTDTGIPEGVEIAAVQAPEGSESVVQLIATSTLDADNVAQPDTGTLPQSNFTYDEVGRLTGWRELGFQVTVTRDPVSGAITDISKAAL